MIVYLYSKCSTCQKALRFLENNKLAFTVKEIVDTPPTITELQKMLDLHQGNLKKLLNTSGQLYREMHLSEKLKTMPISQTLALLSKHGMLIKRPFLLGDDFGLTGFNEEQWIDMLLPNK